MAMKWCTKLEATQKMCPIVFQGCMGKKIDDFIPVLSKITRPVAAIKSLRCALFNVIHQILRSYETKKSPILIRIEHFRTVAQVWIRRWFWYDNIEKMPYRFSRSSIKLDGRTRQKKITDFDRIERFRTVTPVSIHIWWLNDAQSLMLLRRSALLFFKVIRQILRSQLNKSSILTQIGRFGL